MSEAPSGGPQLSAPAELVRRFDPDLFHAALFAPEPARERLMVLAAFDIELSRATAKAGGVAEGPMLAAMRVQFWQDRLEAAANNGPAAAHEVAGPLHSLLTGQLCAAVPIASRLVEARMLELQTPFDDDGFDAWADTRFTSWYRLSLAALGLDDRAGA
ncbi:MAG: squalene/phytoene synthase family protein, partial [Pseudomonadota bacterium]